jgi:peptidoglycan/LPS O-acetylase OafA/YrhL
MKSILKKEIEYFFDLVRCFSILGVISSHVVQTFARPESPVGNSLLYRIFYVGSEGVFSFFLLSGLLMTYLYDKQLGLKSLATPKNIFVKRIARIYPLWLAFLLFWITVSVIGNLGPVNYGVMQLTEKGFGTLNSYMMITIAFGLFVPMLMPIIFNSSMPGGWSIVCEIYHYIFYILTRTKSTLVLLTILTTFNLTVWVIINFPKDHVFLFNVREILLTFPIYQTVFYFVLGMLLMIYIYVYIYMEGGALDFLKSRKKLLFLTIFAIYTATVFSLPTFSKPQIYAIMYCATTLMFSIIFIISKNMYAKRVVLTIAKYSYFLYFVHFVLISISYKIGIIEHLRTSWGMNLLLYMMLFSFVIIFIGLLLAKISYNFFESPLRKIINKYA